MSYPMLRYSLRSNQRRKNMDLAFKKLNRNLNAQNGIIIRLQDLTTLVLETGIKFQIQFLSYQKYYWTTYIYHNKS
jgi:hypothetical protein